MITFYKSLYFSLLFIFLIPNIESEEINNLNLPEGFEINIFANNLDTPRQIAETDNGHILVGSKSGSEVIALIKTNKNGKYEKVIVANDLKNPAGVSVFMGDLYFAEMDTVWVIENIDLWLESDHKKLPEKKIYMNDLPKETWHGLKYIDFGPDGNLYIPVGAPCNSDQCLIKKQEDSRFAAIHKYDGNKLVSVAEGVRNSVGFDWHPVTRKLYFSDNGRDWLGDNTPSCELNVIDEEGSFFGFPYKHAKNIIDPKHGNLISNLGMDFVDPIV